MSRIAEMATSAVTNREKVVKSSETERKERMDTSSLMEQILSSDNLNRAYLQVVRNKGAEGVDGMKYTELKEYLEKNGEIIKEQLRMRKYKPQPVRRVEIPKPDGGVRNLGVPTVTDRFIQQAIAQVLTPIYEEQFHDHSYGFRPNRCAQQAILTALDMMNEGNDWIVDIDLEKFFDTINHDKLMTIIGRTIKDGDVISIVRKYLVSGIMIDDEYEDSIVGTPQGGNLSPLLANIMLNELDKEMEKRGLNFVRYADDCIIMVGSEKSANRVMGNISRFIEEKLGLKVNMTKSKVDRPQGLKYLGFGFYFDSRAHQFKAKPHAKSVSKFKKRMKELTCRSWGVSNSYKVEKLNRLIRGGITAYTGSRIAYVCQRRVMNFAINKERLTRFGLVSIVMAFYCMHLISKRIFKMKVIFSVFLYFIQCLICPGEEIPYTVSRCRNLVKTALGQCYIILSIRI